jgi:DNA-binding ferritin-like protein
MVTNVSVQINPAENVIHSLERERVEVMELRRYLMQVRALMKGRLAPRIQELLDGLFLGVTHSCDLLSVRVNSLSYDSVIGPHPSLPREYRWQIPAGGITTCAELLRSLQGAYAHCARTTVESMSEIASLGDMESFAILRWVSSSIKEALWFIEIYLEDSRSGWIAGPYRHGNAPIVRARRSRCGWRNARDHPATTCRVCA